MDEGIEGEMVMELMIIKVGDMMRDDEKEYLKNEIVIIDEGMIVKMVLWMRKNGRKMKKELKE